MRGKLILAALGGLMFAGAAQADVLYREVFPVRNAVQAGDLSWTFGNYAGDSNYGQPDIEGWYGARRSVTNYAAVRYADSVKDPGTGLYTGGYTITSSTNEPTAVNSNPSVQNALSTADGRTGYLRWTQTNYSNCAMYTTEYTVDPSTVHDISFDSEEFGAAAPTSTRLLVHVGSNFATNWFVSDQGTTNAASNDWESTDFVLSSLTWSSTTVTANTPWPVTGKDPYSYFNATTTPGQSLPAGTLTAFGVFYPTSTPNVKGLDNYTINGVVPEPATLAMLAVGGMVMIRRRA